MEPAKTSEEQCEFVKKQIIHSDIPRDSLPYHTKFDELYHEYQKEGFPELSKNEYWLLILKIAKKGNVRQSNLIKTASVQATEVEKEEAKILVASITDGRDRLPYTKRFDDIYEQFRDRTNSEISKNEFWRLFLTIAKSSRIKHIHSLAIKNFRGLDGLQIKHLGDVNLIVGPNNIGKSSLLEAILLWGTNLHFLVIRDIILARDECDVESPDHFLSSPFLGLHHLFAGFPVLSSQTPPISISTLDMKRSVDLRIDDDPINTNTLSTGPPLSFNLSDGTKPSIPFRLGGTLTLSPSDGIPFKHYLDSKCLYLSPNVSDSARVPINKLWERVMISRRETAVIDSLRLIESGIDEIFFIGSNPSIPVCRLQDYERPVPLHNLGDGISRLFELILGIVNVTGGICLIDEFENGLHWSVQEKVWDVVFQTAKSLDVQIFATTHSLDTLKAFQTVALRQDDESFGGIVQMKKQNGKTVATPIFGDDIRKVLQYEVEVR